MKTVRNHTLRRSMTGRLSMQERMIRTRWYCWVRYLRNRFYRGEGKSDRQFSRDVGITSGALSSMLSRNRDVGITALVKVHQFFRALVPDLTLDRMTYTDPPNGSNGTHQRPPHNPHNHK